MLQIVIEEYINGYGVRVFDSKAFKYRLDEVHKTRLTALEAVELFVKKQIAEEIERQRAHV